MIGTIADTVEKIHQQQTKHEAVADTRLDKVITSVQPFYHA